MSRPEPLRERDQWVEQVWSSMLRTSDRVVALAYGDHARDGLDRVWVALDRLMERTDLSRSAALRSRARLRELGWLVEVEAANQHRSPRYALRRPQEDRESAQGSHHETPEGSHHDTPEEARGRTMTTRGRTMTTRGRTVTPDHSSYLSSYPPAGAGDRAPEPPAAAGSGDGGGGDPRRVEAERAARAAGVDEDVLAAFVERVLADASTEHSIGGRIARDHGWRERHLGAVRGQHAGARRADDVADQARAIFAQVEAAGEAGRRAIATARAAMGVREAERRPLLHARNAARELRDHLDAAAPDAPAVSA